MKDCLFFVTMFVFYGIGLINGDGSLMSLSFGVGFLFIGIILLIVSLYGYKIKDRREHR